MLAGRSGSKPRCPSTRPRRSRTIGAVARTRSSREGAHDTVGRRTHVLHGRHVPLFPRVGAPQCKALVRGPSRRLRARRPRADAGADRRDGRAPGPARAGDHGRLQTFDVSHLPGYPVLQGQITLQDATLKRMPRGFPETHPAAHWLKYQSYTAGRRLSDTQATSARLPTLLESDFAQLLPLVRWLNGALGLRAAQRR